MNPHNPHVNTGHSSGYPAHHYKNSYEESGIKLSWMLGIIGLVVIAGLASLFIFFPGNNGGENQENIVAKTGEGSTSAAIVVDCGDDLDCMIEKSKGCSSIKGKSGKQTIELFGMMITASSSYVIERGESGNCILSSTTESYSVDLGEDLRKELLDSGATEEEIDSIVKEANDNAASVIGSLTLCRFKTDADLTSYLEDTLGGNFSLSFKSSLGSGESESRVNDLLLDCDYIPSQ